jgi:hypothetical protein
MHRPTFRSAYFTLWGRRFGVEFSRVLVGELPYLERWILYVGGLNFRLHKFYRGDDERAPHDHPWWFVTFPLSSYTEMVPRAVYHEGYGGFWMWEMDQNVVRRFRFHYRPGEYKHYVVGRLDGKQKPFWTFVIAGDRSRKWGFWTSPTMFIYWRDWK